ncbi:hypothetical protein E5358_04800 [Palleniella muris]|uniref:Uncharacterized protein n=1 Tax=Palleniella muris TaxID=3038145 RepID=A0AC61QRD0_9BACT|nr:hypothetical protein [Palleniella muris]TGX82983.1 hypothetical protein E5358_04800 [Palleniella muris]
MRKNTKEWLQYGSALGMLASGVLLAFLCFFLNNYNVNDTVLWYVAQCLVYAGSVFGVTVYISTKFGDVRNVINDKMKEDKDEKD